MDGPNEEVLEVDPSVKNAECLLDSVDALKSVENLPNINLVNISKMSLSEKHSENPTNDKPEIKNKPDKGNIFLKFTIII